MNRPPQQAHTRPIAEALGANQMLGHLMARLRESEARLAVARMVLPPAMRPHIRAGVLDAEGWNLLAPNGAVAAKLRQSLPLIEQVLKEHGWPATVLRVKVQSSGTT